MAGFLLTSICLGLLVFQPVQAFTLRAYLSTYGLHGEITFSQNPDKSITVQTKLNATLEHPTQVWSWAVSKFPVDYTQLENRCNQLGDKLIHLDEILGYLILPDNQTMEVTTDELKISGPNGLYGKALLLRNPDTNQLACASLITIGKSLEKSALASFHGRISGQVHFRWFLTKSNESDMLITTDLHHVTPSQDDRFTSHRWKIFVTDILDNGNSVDNCNILQLVFDPVGEGSGKAMGDLDERLGMVQVSVDYNKWQFKELYRDQKLILLPSDLTGPQRRLYLVVFDTKHPDSFLACAQIRYEQPINAKVIIQSGGIKGNITLTQHSRFEPTFLNFNLTTARGDLETKLVYSSSVSGYKIHELPIIPSLHIEQTENDCLTTKYVYNPLKMDLNQVPPNGFGTQDQYAVGDLTGKFLGRNENNATVEGSVELTGKYWDIYLPLQGPHAIIHRSLVIYRNTQYDKTLLSEPWICGNIVLYDQLFQHQRQIFTAEVLFRYPVVGKIIFRQPKDDPEADTTILVDYIIHADGSNINNTKEHRWAVHDLPPGKDFYNWTARCLSAGGVFNTYKVDFNNKTSPKICNMNAVGLCRVGDLTGRHGFLDIAGRKAESAKISRKFFTDTTLPLQGAHGILGKSLVLYDDHGPVARGERMACSKIGGVYRRKAVVRDWFPNGDTLTVKGKLEFYQQTEYDITDVEVDLEGLVQNSGYHVHIAPVEAHLEFPCEAMTLYDHWNPLNVDPASSPRTYHGTPDQYEMGDLSGKFGTLDGTTTYRQNYNDTMLPLFGPRSILGRSVVIHKKELNQRWACSTIERGYSPSEARELRAIASFHHPAGYAYGYIRMTQLIHKDNSKSDTVIEIKLRHPGKNDRNVTRDHDWAIYVNPVGVDAAVKVQDTRCVAGGYMWNPYYTQLADPLNHDLYRHECGPDNPLRCYVGDLSARLGPIHLGFKRQVFSDTNIPLEGDISAIGRSIVIFSPNRQPLRYACANIEPDYDIIKYANIEKPPRFVLAQFIEDVRHVMGIPEWMLSVDSRKIRTLHQDACVQFLLHFKGPIASQLEQDFNRLLSTGRLDSPTLNIPGYLNPKRKATISYKQCGTRDPNEKKSNKYFKLFSNGSQHNRTHLYFIAILAFVTQKYR